jgi:hypothetical protein
MDVFGEQPREFWSQGVRVWIEFSRVKRSGKAPSRKRWKSKTIYRQRTLKHFIQISRLCGKTQKLTICLKTKRRAGSISCK